MALDDALEGANVLLTGATGLIGGEILRRLLNGGPGGPRRVYCLVRPKPPLSPKDRLFERLGLSGVSNGAGSRLDILAGDLTDPRITVCPHESARLRSSVDLIIHCAAETYFLRPQACTAVNVQGLRNLLDFTTECQKPLRFVFFGSAASCGDRKNACLHETDYPEASDHHFVHYTKTKAVAEQILTQHSSLAELMIIRPSIVLPDNLEGGELLSDILWALALMKEVPALPIAGETRVDAIPLSYLGDCALRLIRRRRPRHACYHVSAGESGSAIWGEVVDFLRERCSARIRACDRRDWAAVRSSLTRSERRRVRALAPYLPFLQRNVVFDDGRLRGEFGDAPLSRSHYRGYLPRLLDSITLEEAMDRSADP